MSIQQESDIIKEIKSLGISGNIKLHPSELNFDNLSFDSKHISVREHNVNRDEALTYIKKSRFSIVRWKGKFENYYSEEGAAFVNVEKNEIRTAFKREEFTSEILDALEVLKKYEK